MSCRLLLNTEGNAETDVTFRRNRASARGNPSRAVAAVTQIMVAGGEGGIRTHGRLAPTPVFKTGALNHSATSPDSQINSLLRSPWHPFTELAPHWHPGPRNLTSLVLIPSRTARPR